MDEQIQRRTPLEYDNKNPPLNKNDAVLAFAFERYANSLSTKTTEEKEDSDFLIDLAIKLLHGEYSIARAIKNVSVMTCHLN